MKSARARKNWKEIDISFNETSASQYQDVISRGMGMTCYYNIEYLCWDQKWDLNY